MGALLSRRKSADDYCFEFRLASKHLEAQARRCERERQKELAKLKRALRHDVGAAELARIASENAIRKGNERVTYTRLAARMDAVAGKLATTHEMGRAGRQVRALAGDLERAVHALDLERIDAGVYAFEQQFEHLDVRGAMMQEGMARIAHSCAEGGGGGGNMASSATQAEDVDELIRRTAEENEMELSEELRVPPASSPSWNRVASGQARRQVDGESRRRYGGRVGVADEEDEDEDGGGDGNDAAVRSRLRSLRVP